MNLYRYMLLRSIYRPVGVFNVLTSAVWLNVKTEISSLRRGRHRSSWLAIGVCCHQRPDVRITTAVVEMLMTMTVMRLQRLTLVVVCVTAAKRHQLHVAASTGFCVLVDDTGCVQSALGRSTKYNIIIIIIIIEGKGSQSTNQGHREFPGCFVSSLNLIKYL